LPDLEKRKMKKRMLLVVVLSLIAFTGAVFYWQYTRSPKYSLWKAKQAFEEHDLASFKKYVDIEGLVSKFVDGFTEKRNAYWKLFEYLIASGSEVDLKAQITNGAKQAISDLVEKAEFEKESKDPESKEPIPFSSRWWNQAAKGVKTRFQRIAYVKKEGKIAYIGLPIEMNRKDKPLIVNLKMRNLGSYWQVSSVSPSNEILDIFEGLIDSGMVLLKAEREEMEREYDPGNLRITTLEQLLKSEFVENKTAGRLFVVKGKVRNDYPEARSFIMVKGVLYSKGGKAVQENTVYCGNTLSNSELQTLDKAAMHTRLRNRFGHKRSNFRVPSGKVIPFLLVFSDLPQDLGEFSIEVESSARYSKDS